MPIEAIGQRVSDLADRIKRLEDTNPAVIASQISDVTKDVIELKNDIKGLKRLLVSAMLTVTTAAVVSAITILTTLGGKA